jgi:O-antigen/teichoic acid export membrane protein
LQKTFFRSLLLLIFLNLLVKPVWIFGIDRQVQNITGLASYGKYFALLNLTMVCNFLLDFGITSYFNQQFASGNRRKEGFFSRVILTKLILSILYGGVIVVIGKLSGITDWLLLGLLILLQVLTSFLLLLRAYLTATQQFGRDAIISVADKFIVIIFAGALILAPGLAGIITIHQFVIIQVCAIAVAIITGLVLSFRDFVQAKTGLNGIVKDILFPSLPFAVNIFFMSLMARGDSFLLERLHPQGATEAGIYASSFRLLDAVNMVGFLFAGFLLPYISRHQNDKENIHSTLLSCRNLLLLYVLMSVAFVIAVPGFVNIVLYHHTNPYSEFVLGFTVLSLPSLAFIHIYGTALTASGNIQFFLRISLVFAMINFVLNLFFVGRYGAMGCAIIACSTQLLYAIVTMYFSHKKTGAPLNLVPLLEIVVAALAFWAIVKGAEYLDWNIVVVAVIAGLFISYVLFIREKISLREILKSVTEN